jgi:hypothetical protein
MTVPGTPSIPLRQPARWEDLLALDQPEEVLAVERQRLEAWRSRLRDLAQAMIVESRAAFPGAPVYLATAPDRSHTLLRWRSRRSPGRGGRLEIDDAAVLAWLASESLRQRKRFLSVDRCRCILNDQFSAVVYALQRMQRQNELRRKRTMLLRQTASR